MSKIDADWGAWLRRVQVINDQVRRAISTSAERVRAVVREAVLSEGQEHPGRDVWYPSEHAYSIADRRSRYRPTDPGSAARAGRRTGDRAA